jgi:hypothetical protein
MKMNMMLHNSPALFNERLASGLRIRLKLKTTNKTNRVT